MWHSPDRSIAALVILSFVFVACSDDSNRGEEISEKDYGDKWPFTVASGRVECIAPSKVVFHANGKTYAVNGMASGDKRFRDLREIWRDNPDPIFPKINIGPIIDKGLTLCK